MNGAGLPCDALLANGVDVCFANPGRPRRISSRHWTASRSYAGVLGLFEGVATGAADGCARERLDLLMVIFANRTYSTLHDEMRRVGVSEFGENTRRMLGLGDLALDWVALAAARGDPGASATTVAEFEALVLKALASRSPFLIEALI